MEEITEEKVSGSWLHYLYNRALETCKTKTAPYVLALLSFTESCIFIIPPEVLLLPMSYASRKKSFFYAGVTTIASVAGAAMGYFIGQLFWGEVGPFLFQNLPGLETHFDHVGELFKENAVSALFLAAFTPIPFKVFTLAAGVYHQQIPLLMLLGISLVGRGARYFILSGLVYFMGDKAKELIEKHFKVFTILIAILGVAVILALQFRKH